MELIKSVIRCSDCNCVLQRPVTLPCGQTVCEKHIIISDLPKQTYSCKNCDQQHRIIQGTLGINKAIDKLIQANIQNINLGLEYNQATQCSIELDNLIHKIETLKRDPYSFYHEIKCNLKSKTELLRDEYKQKIDKKTNDMLRDLDLLDDEFTNNLNANEFKNQCEKLDSYVKEINQNMTEWKSVLCDFESTEHQRSAVRKSLEKACLDLKTSLMTVINQSMLNKIRSYLSVLTNFEEVKLVLDRK